MIKWVFWLLFFCFAMSPNAQYCDIQREKLILILNINACSFYFYMTKHIFKKLYILGENVSQSVSAFGCEPKGWWFEPTQWRGRNFGVIVNNIMRYFYLLVYHIIDFCIEGYSLYASTSQYGDLNTFIFFCFYRLDFLVFKRFLLLLIR